MTNEEFQRLLLKKESELLDFKRDGNFKKYIKTIIAIANTTKNQSGYILFGVDDNSKIIGLSKYIRENQVSDFLRHSSISDLIRFQLHNLISEGKKISILEIMAQDSLPIVTTKDLVQNQIYANDVYVRFGSTNQKATPLELEKIFKRILKQDEIPKNQDQSTEPKQKNILKLFLKALKDYEHWVSFEDYDINNEWHVTNWTYLKDTRLSINSRPHMERFIEPWANLSLSKKTSANVYSLKCNGNAVKELYAADLDEYRVSVVYPKTKHFKEGDTFREYFYHVTDTLDYGLQLLLNNGRQKVSLDRYGSWELPVFPTQNKASTAIERDYKNQLNELISFKRTKGYYTYEGEDYPNVTMILDKKFIKMGSFKLYQ